MMGDKQEVKQLSFRMPLSYFDMLDELCKVSGMSRGQYLMSSIEADYEKMEGNPKAKELLEQMKALTDLAKSISPELFK